MADDPPKDNAPPEEPPPPIDPVVPWFAFGMGAGLLAYNAALFYVLVLIAWLSGVAVLFAMFILMLMLCSSGGSSQSCGCDCGDAQCCTCEGCGGCGDCGCGDCGGCDCGGGCGGDCGGGCGGCFAGAAGRTALHDAVHARRDELRPAHRWDRFTAHHPPHAAFDVDVLRAGGVRFCIGCFVTWPVFLVAIAPLTLLAPSGAAWLWMAAGAGLAGAQVLSSLGWLRGRAGRIVVKAALGTGMAFMVHGILRTAWPDLVQAVALAVLLMGAALSVAPRGRNMARRLQSH